MEPTAVHEKQDLSLRHRANKYLNWAFVWMVLIQYIGFKISWLLAAWGAVAGPPLSYWGALPFFLFLILHVIYTRRIWELWFALSVALIGTGLDTICNATGLIHYNGTYPVLSFLAPLWITSLWAGLAVTLDHSLKMLAGRPIWTFAIFAIFGPLAYWTGHEMGAIQFTLDPWTTMFILAAPWGITAVFYYQLLQWWRPVETANNGGN
jgi:hypothetical protein